MNPDLLEIIFYYSDIDSKLHLAQFTPVKKYRKFKNADFIDLHLVIWTIYHKMYPSWKKRNLCYYDRPCVFSVSRS